MEPLRFKTDRKSTPQDVELYETRAASIFGSIDGKNRKGGDKREDKDNEKKIQKAYQYRLEELVHDKAICPFVTDRCRQKIDRLPLNKRVSMLLRFKSRLGSSSSSKRVRDPSKFLAAMIQRETMESSGRFKKYSLGDDDMTSASNSNVAFNFLAEVRDRRREERQLRNPKATGTCNSSAAPTSHVKFVSRKGQGRTCKLAPKHPSVTLGHLSAGDDSSEREVSARISLNLSSALGTGDADAKTTHAFKKRPKKRRRNGVG